MISPPLKPPFKRKPMRLPVRKRMTIIVGLKHNEGLVVAADSEENSNLKRRVPKLPVYLNTEGGALIVGVSCLNWNWRERSSVKITERTHAKRAEALHCRREGWHPKTAFAG